MAPATVTVTIEDEGYFKKTFAFSQVLNLRKLLDLYRSRICEECSDPDLLEFWYETTKVSNVPLFRYERLADIASDSKWPHGEAAGLTRRRHH